MRPNLFPCPLLTDTAITISEKGRRDNVLDVSRVVNTFARASLAKVFSRAQFVRDSF